MLKRTVTGSRRFHKASLTAPLVVVVLAGILLSGPARAASTTALAWGANANGGLCNGNTTNQTSPVSTSAMPDGGTIEQIAFGNSGFTLARSSYGNVYACGYNNLGQLGNGTTTSSSSWVKVSLASGLTATAIAAGNETGYAIASDGNEYSWGGNPDGALGDGLSGNSSTPVEVKIKSPINGASETVTAIAAGYYHGLALGSDGFLYAWGDNSYGALDYGSTANTYSTPHATGIPQGLVSGPIAAGFGDSFAVIGSHLYAWGNNQYGQLGLGTESTTGCDCVASPVEVTALSSTPVAISAMSENVLVLGADGNIYSWGYNFYGQVGNGTTTTTGCWCQPSASTTVSLPSGVTSWTAISAGSFSNYAVGSDGNTYAWGYNGDGELGNGGTSNASSPVEVSLSSSQTAVSSGAFAYSP